MFDLNASKSYATEENLQKALAKLGFADHRHLVARTPAGRWTAIFPVSNLTSDIYGQAGNVMLYARQGFMTLG